MVRTNDSRVFSDRMGMTEQRTLLNVLPSLHLKMGDLQSKRSSNEDMQANQRSGVSLKGITREFQLPL